MDHPILHIFLLSLKVYCSFFEYFFKQSLVVRAIILFDFVPSFTHYFVVVGNFAAFVAFGTKGVLFIPSPGIDPPAPGY